MQHSDVIVIGGGLLGCAAAYYLSKGGAAVTLLERGPLNRQASGQNAGSLHFQLEHRMVEHGDTLAEQFAISIPLNLDAETRWAALENELNDDLEIVQHGGLMVAETAPEARLLEKKCALEWRWGLKTQLLTGHEARQIAPYLSDSVVAASYYRGEGHGNPRLIAPAFARAAKRLGATVHTNRRVTGLHRHGSTWVVESGRHPPLQATAVLIAAGAWTPEIAGMAGFRLPVIPIALTMNATEAAPPLVSHLIQHVGRRLSTKQMRAGNILIGGGWPSQLPTNLGLPNLERRPEFVVESVAGNIWTAVQLVPAISQYRIIRSWTGLVGVTADQIPVLGEVPRRPGLFVATGGTAFTLGPTFAGLISELIMHRRTSLPIEPYSPSRFGHLNFI